MLRAMASRVLRNAADRFGIGATVYAYPVSQQSSPGVAPAGAAVDSAQVASDGSLTFAQLGENTSYVAWDGSRGIRFRTDPQPSTTTQVQALALRKGQRLVADELTAPVMVQPPVQSFSNPAGAVASLPNVTSIANGALIPWTDPRFQYLGGVFEAHTPAGYGSDLGAFHTTKFDGSGTNADRQGFVPFDVTCSAFEILEYGNASQWLNIYVDGRPVWLAPQPQSVIATLAGGSLYLRRVEFATRAKRTIKLLLDSVLFGGIYLARTDALAPAALGDSIRHLHVGDSYAVSGIDGPSNQTHRQDGNYAWRMSRLLGIQDFWNDSYGGTGFLATQADTVPTYRQRMSRWPSSASAVSFQTSINDAFAINAGTFDATALQAEVLTTLRATRAKYGDSVPIVVFGILRPRAALAIDVVANSASAAAVAASGDARIFFVDPITGGWFSGTGKVGATTGDGTADVHLASDGNHPSAEGHVYIGPRCARAFADAVGVTIIPPAASRSDRQYASRSASLPLASAALTTDPQLALDLPAGAVRRVRALIFYEATVAAGFKVGWSLPAGAKLQWGIDGIWDLAETDSLSVPGSGAGTINTLLVEGVVVNGATAGQLALQTAQNVLSIVNLSPNSGFEADLTGATLDHSNDTGTTLTQSATWADTGSKSAKIDGQITAAGGWVGVLLQAGGAPFAVTAGKGYTFTAKVNVTDAAINSNGLQAKIEWRNAGNAVVATTIKVLGTAAGVQSVAVTDVAPAGATQAVLYIINQSGTVGDQVTFYVDSVVFASLDAWERPGTFLQAEPVSA